MERQTFAIDDKLAFLVSTLVQSTASPLKPIAVVAFFAVPCMRYQQSLTRITWRCRCAVPVRPVWMVMTRFTYTCEDVTCVCPFWRLTSASFARHAENMENEVFIIKVT